MSTLKNVLQMMKNLTVKSVVKSVVNITLDSQDFTLTREEAKQLFDALKQELGVVDPVVYKEIFKEVPSKDKTWPLPNRPQPIWEDDYPKFPYPQIWLDSLRYNLQESLTTEQLAKFAIRLGENLTEEEDFYLLLIKKLNKILKESEAN